MFSGGGGGAAKNDVSCKPIPRVGKANMGAARPSSLLPYRCRAGESPGPNLGLALHAELSSQTRAETSPLSFSWFLSLPMADATSQSLHVPSLLLAFLRVVFWFCSFLVGWQQKTELVASP